MAEIQLSAGAKSVRPAHELARHYIGWAETHAAIAELTHKPCITTVGSAHVMGGCPMATAAQRGIVHPDGQHWQIKHLSVLDGSICSTSIDANPQMTVDSQAARLSAALTASRGVKAPQLP